MFNNKTILITGGTGSFGREFCKSILEKFNPKKVIIYSRDEFKQYEMKIEMEQFFSKKKSSCLRFFIGDIRDLDRLKMSMKDTDYVVHAAALKQVPAAEYNPMEFVKTNINGAENIIQAAISQNVKKIIALSTDKAANPINLYGASKLASDKIFIAANNVVGKQNTSFSVVRYGNVLGSRGSIIPLFQKYIRENKKFLPVTDKRMTRFFITLNQSVEFVIKSFKGMSGGEIFIPKIPSIKIVDLAKAMAPNLKQKIVGIRFGEKLHELMCPNESYIQTYEFKDFFVIFPYEESYNPSKNLKKKILGNFGKRVKSTFEYDSENNSNFLSVTEIKNLLKKTSNDSI